MVDITSICPQLKRQSTKTSSGSEVCCYISDLGPDVPILTLVHGYPQSAFEWRHLVPILADKVSLFVPELPGYGVSTPQKDNTKRGIGATLLEAMQTVFSIGTSSPRKVILGGHDRGARLCHRLTVDKDKYPALDVLGTIMIDIVPTKAQWEGFANPAISVGYYHWPMLANVEVGFKLINAYGGGNWCRDANTRLCGPNEEGLKRLKAHNAVEVYAELFDKEETLKYSGEDYAAGAFDDVEQQTEDQKAGRKIEVPTLVLFSEAKLGARLDVEKIWKDWIQPGVAYKGVGVGNGHGHYLPEEASDIVAEHVLSFLKDVKAI